MIRPAHESRGEPDPTAALKPTDALHLEIHGEIKRLFRLENGYAWLASPQPLLDMRIPARMLASGEGRVVLHVLQGTPTP